MGKYLNPSNVSKGFQANRGTLWNTIRELVSGPSEYSSSGLQRAENAKARNHATTERQASELFNKNEAQLNRDFQERMSNTTYQRMMSDLQASGINPMFAISSGGAPAPSGATAASSPSPSGAASTKSSLEPIVNLIGTIASSFNTASLVSARQNKSLLDLSKIALNNSNSALSATKNTHIGLQSNALKLAQNPVQKGPSVSEGLESMQKLIKENTRLERELTKYKDWYELDEKYGKK